MRVRWTSRRSSSAWPRTPRPQPTLQALGWQGGVYRQFTGKPPAGRVGWVDISVHRFPDAESAAEAVAYFAASRAQSMDLQPVPAPTIGESSAALAGPAVNGTEYSLYLSQGSMLYAVTGVAPDSGSDPRADVETIATALMAPTAATSAGPGGGVPDRHAGRSRRRFRRPWRPSPPSPPYQRWSRSLFPPRRPFRHRPLRHCQRQRRRCWPQFRPPRPSRRHRQHRRQRLKPPRCRPRSHPGRQSRRSRHRHRASSDHRLRSPIDRFRLGRRDRGYAHRTGYKSREQRCGDRGGLVTKLGHYDGDLPPQRSG